MLAAAYGNTDVLERIYQKQHNALQPKDILAVLYATVVASNVEHFHFLISKIDPILIKQAILGKSIIAIAC